MLMLSTTLIVNGDDLNEKDKNIDEDGAVEGPRVCEYIKMAKTNRKRYISIIYHMGDFTNP